MKRRTWFSHLMFHTERCTNYLLLRLMISSTPRCHNSYSLLHSFSVSVVHQIINKLTTPIITKAILPMYSAVLIQSSMWSGRPVFSGSPDKVHAVCVADYDHASSAQATEGIQNREAQHRSHALIIIMKVFTTKLASYYVIVPVNSGLTQNNHNFMQHEINRGVYRLPYRVSGARETWTTDNLYTTSQFSYCNSNNNNIVEDCDLSWLNNDGTRGFSVDQLKGKGNNFRQHFDIDTPVVFRAKVFIYRVLFILVPGTTAIMAPVTCHTQMLCRSRQRLMWFEPLSMHEGNTISEIRMQVALVSNFSECL